jgi:protein phosphatase
MRISAFGLTDVGRKRSNNEDGFVLVDLDAGLTIDPPAMVDREVGTRGILLAVCDGMGGHQAGEVASALALETLAGEMEAIKESCPPRELFKRAVDAVNTRVWNEARLHPQLAGMGTTLTAALVCRGRAIVGHVGDSRAYFARKGGVEQITRDQSIAGALIARGVLSEEAAQDTPFKNVLLQAIGTKDRVEIALDGVGLAPGDTLLLCSDGLSNKVTRDDLAKALAEPDLGSAARGLVALANERGGEDNITVVLCRASG